MTDCMQGVACALEPVGEEGSSSSRTTMGAVVRLKRPRPASHISNRVNFLRQRETGGNTSPSPELRSWIEGETLRKLDTGEYIELDKSAQLVRSTISIAFSHDGHYFASTHGDHSVKVFEYPSCRQIACLEGHPRTPWIVRFHPSNSSIIASCRNSVFSD